MQPNDRPDDAVLRYATPPQVVIPAPHVSYHSWVLSEDEIRRRYPHLRPPRAQEPGP